MISTPAAIISALGAAHQYPHSDHQYPAYDDPLRAQRVQGMLEYCRGGTAASHGSTSQRSASPLIAAHRVRIRSASHSQGGRTPTLRLPSSASPAPKARRWGPPASASRWLQRVALCCNVSSCVAACRPVLQRGPVGLAPGRRHRSIAPLSVPRALWRRARGSDHVGQGVKTACRTAAAAMPADAVRHAHCAATITYMCVLVSVLQRRGNPHVAARRLGA